MTAFPTSSSDIVTTNLDSASDKPKDARQDLFNALTKLKTVIDSFDANSGICGLTSSGKVDSSKLTGQVVKASLGADCVDGTKIEDDSIDSEHIVDGSVDYQHISFGSASTSLGTSNALLPTQGAVKTYVDTTATTLQTAMNNTAPSNACLSRVTNVNLDTDSVYPNPFTAGTWDTQAGHSSYYSFSNGVVTILEAGTYLCGYSGTLVSTSYSTQQFSIYKGTGGSVGTTIIDSTTTTIPQLNSPNSVNTQVGLSGSGAVKLSANDTLACRAKGNNGGCRYEDFEFYIIKLT